jgi:hypothetical protein
MKLPLPESEVEKIALTIQNKPERVLKSETVKTVLNNDRQRRETLRGKLNRTVRQFVDIIDCFQFEKEPSQEMQSIAALELDIIADILVRLSEKKAHQLDEEVCAAIVESTRNACNTSSASDLGEIVVSLHTCPRSSKEQRFEKINKQLDEIANTNAYPKATAILVVAWNPLDPFPQTFDLSYEIRNT